MQAYKEQPLDLTAKIPTDFIYTREFEMSESKKISVNLYIVCQSCFEIYLEEKPTGFYLNVNTSQNKKYSIYDAKLAKLKNEHYNMKLNKKTYHYNHSNEIYQEFGEKFIDYLKHLDFQDDRLNTFDFLLTNECFDFIYLWENSYFSNEQ